MSHHYCSDEEKQWIQRVQPGQSIQDAAPLSWDLFSQISITPQVLDEVDVRGQGKPGALEDQPGFIHRRAVVETSRIAEVRHWLHVGEGEASTIILADELKAGIVLIDDKAAREGRNSLGAEGGRNGTLRVTRRGMMLFLRYIL